MKKVTLTLGSFFVLIKKKLDWLVQIGPLALLVIPMIIFVYNYYIRGINLMSLSLLEGILILIYVVTLVLILGNLKGKKVIIILISSLIILVTIKYEFDNNFVTALHFICYVIAIGAHATTTLKQKYPST